MLITEKDKIEHFYQGLLNRDQSLVGVFFVGVKTTSVFCISNCRARTPKRENVEFFTTFKDALDNGYRPCKICKPTENANQAPDQVEGALKLIKENPRQKISDYQLKQNNISPHFVRRWFKKNYGMTFQAYQRMYRINHAYLELKNGKKATSAAYDIGYDSLSGFGYTFKKIVGHSPQKRSDSNVIQISRLTTPLGPMFVCASDNGICLLEFVDRKMLETEFRDIQRLLNANIIAGENVHIKQAKKELEEYFSGTRRVFGVSLETPGTDFQKTVWHNLREIDYGQTSTYQQQAERIGRHKAVRAMAAANGANRIAIIIPCHRVIGKNGQLTGYGGGIERKRWLIDHEKSNPG